MSIRTRMRDESGIAIIVVIAFLMVFLGMGAALVMLLAAGRNSTELERKEVKSFNVAEAGIDAGMLALKLAWPDTPSSSVTVDDSILRTVLQAANPGLYDPSRSPTNEFIEVLVYDNVNADGVTTSIPDPNNGHLWDTEGDDMMFVDSRSNVDDDRHRIIVLAQRQVWPLDFPAGHAMWASNAGANGQGLKVYIDPLSPTQSALAYWATDFGKGVERGPHVDRDWDATDFSSVVTDQTWRAMENIAIQQETYFTSATAASTFLSSGNAGGNVVYVKANNAVTVAGTAQMGSRDKPLILVLDTPADAYNTIDLKGTSDFYGIIIVRGNTMIRGTASIWGQMLCSGTIEGKGTGSVPEINYNSQIIANLNRDFVISVNIVPNTWEEYTIPPDQL